jgi:class 3 adenylate cyclase
MTFDEVLAQVLDLLQREGRVSYRALKRRFALDDDYLKDVKAELIEAKQLAIDEEGKVLVWVGEADRQGAQPPQVGSASPKPRTPEAERRHLTVLFCDVVNATALAVRLDPEAYHGVIRAYHTVCAAVIERFDGHLAQYLGDGLLV